MMNYIKKSPKYIIIAVITFTSLFPFLWMITTAIRKSNEIFTIPPRIFPHEPTWINFRTVLFESEIPRYFLNSILVAIMTTILCLAFSIPAGYSLARFKYKSKYALSVSILFCQMIPQVSTLIPLYITMEKIGLVNTRVGLSLSHQLLVIPFAVWMIRGFIVSIPKSLEESAMIDGCSRIGTILRIIIPVGASGIFATSLYIWILAWEEFPYALTFINTSALRTISVGIDQFSSEYQVDWGSVMTTSLLMTLPIVTMFYLIQDKFIKGIVEGALKE